MRETPVPIRLTDDIVGRADALVPRLEGMPEFAAFRITRSSVLRLAILRGLASLEEESKTAKRRK